MFRFAHLHILYLLFIIPFLYAGFIFYLINYKKRIKQFGDVSLVKELMPLQSKFSSIAKFSLLMLVLAFLILGLARLQFGTKLQEVKSKGIELIIALDISNSMMATDIAPSRLERSKQAVQNLIGRMKNDQIGIIIFAGSAYSLLPITPDYISAKMFLSNVNTNFISKQGTAIADAIDLAMHSFSQNTNSSKAIVIISDGEDHEGNALDLAAQAKEKGIKVYTIGMGSVAGSLIPRPNGQGFFTDKSGNPVTTRMNPEILKSIAESGGGEYFTATTSNVGLNRLYDELSRLNKTELETKKFAEYNDQYFYFIWAALILFIIEILIFERKNIWLNKIKLFD